MKCTIACFCVQSISSPSPYQMKESLRWLRIVHTSYICCHTFISFLLVCSQTSAFFACGIFFCATVLVDYITLQDLIFDYKSYCSSKLSKPLRSCGKLLSPFVVNDAAGTSACSGIVTSLWLYFYSLREGNSTFRGYTASYIAPKELGLGDVGIGKELEGAAPSGKIKLLLFTSSENQLSRR